MGTTESTQNSVPIENQFFDLNLDVKPSAPPLLPAYFNETRGKYYDAIKERIDHTIAEKNLQHFYPTYSPQYVKLLNRASNIDYETIARRRTLSLEQTIDLASLALYDIVIMLDDSTSMAHDQEWKRSDRKLKEVKFILSRISEIATLFDEDGITIKFMNGMTAFDNIKTEADALHTIDNINLYHGTPLGRMLKSKILDPMVIDKINNGTFNKPVLIFVVTDGAPDDHIEVRDNIRQCKMFLNDTPCGKSGISLVFSQVGNDQNATAYLSEVLDKDPVIGQDVDTIGNFEIESIKYARKNIKLTPDRWILHMSLGGLDSRYDESND